MEVEVSALFEEIGSLRGKIATQRFHNIIWLGTWSFAPGWWPQYLERGVDKLLYQKGSSVGWGWTHRAQSSEFRENKTHVHAHTMSLHLSSLLESLRSQPHREVSVSLSLSSLSIPHIPALLQLFPSLGFQNSSPDEVLIHPGCRTHLFIAFPPPGRGEDTGCVSNQL